MNNEIGCFNQFVLREGSTCRRHNIDDILMFIMPNSQAGIKETNLILFTTVMVLEEMHAW